MFLSLLDTQLTVNSKTWIMGKKKTLSRLWKQFNGGPKLIIEPVKEQLPLSYHSFTKKNMITRQESPMIHLARPTLLTIINTRLESYNDPRPSTNQSTSLKNDLALLFWFVLYKTYVRTDGHHQQNDWTTFQVCAWAWINFEKSNEFNAHCSRQ